VWKSLDEPAAVPPAAEPTRRKQLTIGVGVAAALLAVLAGLWAGGVFSVKVQTKDGVIALQDLPPDAEVLVDGNRVSVKLADDGKTFDVQVAPGKHELEVRTPGFTMKTPEVAITTGERKPILVRLEPVAAAPAKAGLPPVAPKDAGSGGELPPTFTNSVGMEFVLVPTGKSWLGGGGGRPGDKEVTIARDFYLGKYEVTQEEWQKVTGFTPSYYSRTGGRKDAVKDIADTELKRFPVEGVSQDDARAFVERLNKLEKDAGWVYRLPKEVEWEYACRGGPLSDKFESAYYFYLDKPTNQLSPEQANFDQTGLKRPCRVGSYQPNRLGLYDMHGNVWEWCDDGARTAGGYRTARTEAAAGSGPPTDVGRSTATPTRRRCG
jgi:formylglycine-generating enzyme required for sulfatase activity